MKLHSFASAREAKDVEAETSMESTSSSIISCPLPKDGLKMYWKEKNEKSIDGLPGLLSAFDSHTKFVIKPSEKWGQDDESPGEPLKASPGIYVARGIFSWTDIKLFLCFLLGWVACVIWTGRG